MKNKLKLLVALSALYGTTAMAAIDTSFVDTMQADITTVVTAIGTAMLICGGIAVSFKWGRGAIFG